MGNIIVETVSDTSRFESLKDTWNSLLLKSRGKSIYLTWEWLFTWWKHYGSGKELNILLVRDEDRITAIAPFMLSRYRLGIIREIRYTPRQ